MQPSSSPWLRTSAVQSYRPPHAVDLLRTAFREEREHHSFDIVATVILPDHVHSIWTLPPGDTRVPMRWSAIKGRFTELFLSHGGVETGRSGSRRKRIERGVWQRRFWEHVIRDERDFDRHLDYIHFNPVKHGHATCPHAWAYSSFHRWVQTGIFPNDWMCVCQGKPIKLPDFTDFEDLTGE